MYTLKPGERPNREFRRIALETLDHSLAEIATAAEGGFDEAVAAHAVHEVRKSGKRLRALLRLIRPGLGDGYTRENRALRDVARGLSEWRDDAVLRQTYERLAEQTEAPTQSFEAIGMSVISQPSHLVVGALQTAAAQLEAVRGRAKRWSAKKPRRAIAAGAAEVYRQGRQLGMACRRQGDDARWHEWRKAVKRHGYHAQLFSRLHHAAPTYAELGDRLGRMLGEEHDLSVLLAAMAAAGHTASAIAAAAEKQRLEFRIDALRLGRELYGPPPHVIRSVVRGLLASTK